MVCLLVIEFAWIEVRLLGTPSSLIPRGREVIHVVHFKLMNIECVSLHHFHGCSLFYLEMIHVIQRVDEYMDCMEAIFLILKVCDSDYPFVDIVKEALLNRTTT